MNTITNRIFKFIFVFFITVNLLPQDVFITSAATNATVYEDSPMLEYRGYIYYIQTVNGVKNTFNIYRLEVATGNKTKLISSKKDIVGMMIHNDTLYYNSHEDGKNIYQTQISSVSIDGKEKKDICNGYLTSLDDNSIYYIVVKGNTSKLYKRDYDSRNATLIHTGNIAFSFVKNLDNTLYFTQFNETSSKITLYSLTPGQTRLSILTTDKIILDGSEKSGPTVSDIIKLNGDIYYQYGVYEGSGSYWNGTLIKINSSANTKSIIEKQVSEEEIYHNDNSIFFVEMDSSEKHYQYNTKTGKKSSYTYKIGTTESFNILGDKTYCIKPDGKELITVSCFTSGTNKSNWINSFIKISYKQKKEFDYITSIKKYGNYLLIPVKCMDYKSTKVWWGKCVSITWYVADSDGKILAQF